MKEKATTFSEPPFKPKGDDCFTSKTKYFWWYHPLKVLVVIIDNLIF